MATPTLKTVTRLQGNNAALINGKIAPEGFRLQFEEVPVLVHAFRRMVRGLEFDVCEMALTTYLCAREHGVKFTALPIFLVRAFHHGAILHDRRAPIRDPRKLEGTRIGVNRGYTVTTGVWARSILQDEYGVDLGTITWVLSGDEHVESYRPPKNVQEMAPGFTLEGQLLAGELAAVINVKPEDPNIQPMILNPLEAGISAFQRRGHYPINHCIVVRDDVLEAHPAVAGALFEAFAASKQQYLQRLSAGQIATPDASDRLYQRLAALGADPLPYGIEPNRRVLEELIGHAMAQKILTRSVDVDDLFAPVPRDSSG